MSKKINSLLLVLLISCASSHLKVKKPVGPISEKLLTLQLLVEVHDSKRIGPHCVQGTNDALVLIRTLRPHVEDIYTRWDFEWDKKDGPKHLIEKCQNSCYCIDLYQWIKSENKKMTSDLEYLLKTALKNEDREECLNFTSEKFCDTKLYQILDQDRGDFELVE